MDIIKYLLVTIFIFILYLYDIIKLDIIYNNPETTMKLRYFSDDYIYFKILGASTDDGFIKFNSILDKDLIHKSLKDCTVYMLQNVSLRQEIDNIYKSSDFNHFDIIVLMTQISDKRSSEPNNILYFCESALFKFNKNLKCTSVVFNFRKSIDPLLEYATLYYIGDNVLYYSDKSVIANDYFKEITSDRQLAEFVLQNKQSIIY